MAMQTNSPVESEPMQVKHKIADLETLNSYGLMLNVEQTAKVLGVSKATVRTYIKSGDIPSVVIGRSFRVPRFQLAKFCGLPVEMLGSEN